MSITVENLPSLFVDVKKVAPQGMRVSERVVEPVVFISRNNDHYEASLAGRHRRGFEITAVKAPSNRHNWVVKDNHIQPLPLDSPDEFDRVLEGYNKHALSFSDVISLARSDGAMDVELDSEVLQPTRQALKHINTELLVAGLNATLYPYQAQGVTWMKETVDRTSGLILADEMGLGKTIQIIALLLLHLPTKDSPALIVCPTSLIANWQREIELFAPGLSYTVHRGSSRTGIYKGLKQTQVVISTYETVVLDRSIFEAVNWSWLVCDEAQALKNPDSNRHQAIASLTRQRSIPVTGTPVETSLLDLWALTNIAIPGLLGDRASFEARYDDGEDASAALLNQITAAVVLRRLVAQVAGDLPDRIEVNVPLELGEELARAYSDIRRETLREHPKAGALVATGRLQMFCAHPWLQFTPETSNEDATASNRHYSSISTPKIERTVSILEEAFSGRKKVLLFTLYNGCIDIFENATQNLPDAFWGAINGSTPQADRQGIVDAFSRYDGPGCLVLNPKAAGAGLNITAATVVIHFTLAWNPALEMQASARAHRRGQTNPVHIYRLYYANTVEEVMLDRSERRREMGEIAVPTSATDSEDLERALSIEP